MPKGIYDRKKTETATTTPTAEAAPKRRGRPPKAAVAAAATPETPAAPKRRGRPPKAATAAPAKVVAKKQKTGRVTKAVAALVDSFKDRRRAEQHAINMVCQLIDVATHDIDEAMSNRVSRAISNYMDVIDPAGKTLQPSVTVPVPVRLPGVLPTLPAPNGQG